MNIFPFRLPLFSRLKSRRLVVAFTSACIFIAIYFAGHFDFSDELHGFYLLSCDRGRLFDLKGDLLLGEENRLLAKFEFDPILDFFRYEHSHKPNHPHLTYSWNRLNGSGYVFNYHDDGTMLLTCFSRFRDSRGEIPKGVFVGGGLPYSKHDNAQLTMSATGMAHFDGKSWHHLWCNANETIASSPDDKHDPSTWDFLGSKVLFSDDKKLIIRSSHSVPFGATTLRIDRYAIFRAGENYFILLMKLTNIGNTPAYYYYVYGDEPWVGQFGSSGGNIGWAKGRLFYFEGSVDPRQYSYAGMYDIGNPMILGEKGSSFSGKANFIEWIGDNKPNLVYFSNKEGQFAEEKERVPLASKDNRVIFLQWGPRPLMPRDRDFMILAIGLANKDPHSMFPVKPDVGLDQSDFDIILSDSP
ncbi:hypothetical protein [Geotalea sp. SG265]|uniref:hypothetical protein n=1 Tax=Geotalea sp. SG265 TaxID=2922867 RepID=UPI001FAF16B0